MNATPYYHEIPQGFRVPAIFFPVPEVTSSGDTTSSYRLEYEWYIKIIASETNAAYAIALNAVKAIKENHNAIPLYTIDNQLTGKSFWIRDPSIRKVDDGTIQLLLRWKSSVLYTEQSSEETMNIVINQSHKQQ